MTNGDLPEKEAAETPAPQQPPADSAPTDESVAENQATDQPTAETPADEPKADEAAQAEPGSAEKQPGPLSQVSRGNTSRGSGPLAARGLGISKPASPAVDPAKLRSSQGKSSGEGKPKQGKKKQAPRPRVAGDKPEKPQGKKEQGNKEEAIQPSPQRRSGIAVPSVRQALPEDLQAELDSQLAGADLDSMLGGSAGMPDRREPLTEGARVQGQVLKIHQDNVFVSLGGPDEGVVPFEQFEKEPEIGSSIEVVVRGISRDDNLYSLSLPGGAIDASDWEDLDEGTVVEATVTGSNSGGLECKVGGMKGFIPISQISEYRVEDTSEFIDKKLRCVVTEANQRRGNLVLSHRAVLEREREEKRKEQLEKIQPGDELEGIVRSIKDFGAFVDLGGLDGLIHISKLSWERVKHPSEVLEEGQKVKVKIDSIDKEKGKISLSYRDLLENPWDTAEAEFAVGTVHKGVVTRIANFGCFVRLTAGVEGLVHISELAHHRVSKVDAFVSEGDEVEVKVLSFDRDSQKVGLSIKAAQQPAVDTKKSGAKEDEVDEPPREPAVRASHSGPLKGGNDRPSGGERFGLRW